MDKHSITTKQTDSRLLKSSTWSGRPIAATKGHYWGQDFDLYIHSFYEVIHCKSV